MKFLRIGLLLVAAAIIAVIYSQYIKTHQHDHASNDHADHEQVSASHAGHDHAQLNDHEMVEDDEADHDHAEPHEHGIAEEDHTDHDHAEPHKHEITEEDHAGHDHAAEDLIVVDAAWEALIGLETTVAQVASVDRLISVPGLIVPHPDRVAVISPFIESSVNCVFHHVGDRVKKDEVLVCLTSPEVGMLRAEYDKARAELDIAQRDFDRQKKLFDDNIISQKRFQEAELAREVAQVNFNYAEKKLNALGIHGDELAHPPTGHSDAVGATLHMTTPIAGVVTHRDANPGQKVDPAHRLFEIMDITELWCEADLFEKDLTRIRVGQTVKLHVSAYVDETFTGTIFHIGSTLHPKTKTIKVLIQVDNPLEKLKPGMFAQTHIVAGRKENALVIPKSAVLDDEELKIVFVREGNGYHRHVVETGIQADDRVEILSGLEPGARVVTQGNYQLKSKARMTGVDPHAGHVH